MKLDPSQIDQAGAVVGDTLIWNGTEWAPGAGGPTTEPLFADDDASALVADDGSDYLYADS